MPAVDEAAAVLFLGATAGTLLARALRAWIGFRRQERTVRLLAAALADLERTKQSGRR